MTELTSKRLLSLDVMRGLTIAGMLLVNNSGGGDYVYAPLLHAPWEGLTMADLVFPFFMFIMGVSMYFSLSRFEPGLNWKVVRKITLRFVLLFAVGLALKVILMWFSGKDLRFLGVIQRLAIAYFVGALIAQSLKFRNLLPVAAVILAVYAVILWLGHGFELSAQNVVGRFDTFFINEKHLYMQTLPDGTKIPFEPEGLLSNLPCFAHVLFGIYVGKILKSADDVNGKMLNIFIFGTVLLVLGFILKDIIPVIKRVWTPTYVLLTCGAASLLLALLTWIIDVKGWKRWTLPFEAFGINPLFLYVTGTILGYAMKFIRIVYEGERTSLRRFVYEHLLTPWISSEYLASLVYSLVFVGVIFLIGYPLYRRRIYIKL